MYVVGYCSAADLRDERFKTNTSPTSFKIDGTKRPVSVIKRRKFVIFRDSIRGKLCL